MLIFYKTIEKSNEKSAPTIKPPVLFFIDLYFY